MKNNIKPGDMIIPSPYEGLGSKPCLVLEVHEYINLRSLYILASNGTTWWATDKGAQVITSMQSPAGT